MVSCYAVVVIENLGYKKNMAESLAPDNILTKREFEILKLLAQGNKDSKIASLLYISPLTVKTHRKNILKKLQVKNCAEAIYKATKLNWI